MEARTQFELAGITVALAMCAGTYSLGKPSSEDTVNQLEKSLASYEKADKINTEEFIDLVITTTSELKLSLTERKYLREQESINEELNRSLTAIKQQNSDYKSVIDEKNKEVMTLNSLHKEIISELQNKNQKLIQKKESEIERLVGELAHFKAPSFSFKLAEGQGRNLKKGTIQVGLSVIEFGNTCKVSVNNERREMKAGDFSVHDDCRVTLTGCNHDERPRTAEFEMVCSVESSI
ncbi:hypothetical protein [Pseudoalteromonas 'SMAR']|uniref:hypothetical protein n=1 Tax=Pseudoalteromonas 'SMAR' TaxID=3416908 RepID=UPI003AF28D11